MRRPESWLKPQTPQTRGSRKFGLSLLGAIIDSARLVYSVMPFCSRQMIDIIVGLRLWALP